MAKKNTTEKPKRITQESLNEAKATPRKDESKVKAKAPVKVEPKAPTKEPASPAKKPQAKSVSEVEALRQQVEAMQKEFAALKAASGSVAQKLSTSKADDVHYRTKAQIMKEHLAKQPKVKFMIPLGVGEKKGAYETVQLNGYRLNIMKGVMVDLPEQVAELLAESYKITLEVGEDFLIDRSKAVQEALS